MAPALSSRLSIGVHRRSAEYRFHEVFGVRGRGAEATANRFLEPHAKTRVTRDQLLKIALRSDADEELLESLAVNVHRFPPS